MAQIPRALLLTSLAIALAPLLSSGPAQAQNSNPPLPIKEAAFTRWVFGRNGSIENAAFACKAQTGACVPGARHLQFVAPVAVPAMTSCASGAATLMSCYAGAVERTQQALEQGSAWLLYEAAERVRVVTVRANASGTAPAWMKSASASNLLYRFFVDQGVALAAPIGCTTGTEAARYQCLGTGGTTAAVHRAVIGVLDHHGDVRVNWGQTAGARARLENLLRSATAPAIAAMTAANKLDPRLGPGLPRLDLLGKISYLRRLTGEAGTLDVERAYLAGLTAYQVSTASTRVGAELALFAAARAARWTDPVTEQDVVIDAAIDADLKALLIDGNSAVALSLIRGDTAAAHDAGATTAYYASARAARPFDLVGVEVRFQGPLVGLDPFVLGWMDGLDHCDWFTVEDIMIGVARYYPVTTTDKVWIPDCLPQNPGCDGGGHWDTITTTTWVTGPTTWIKIGENILVESIRHNYNLLLNADDLDEDGDPDFVDVDGNGGPDHDLDSDGALISNPTIARTGISADECLAELTTVSGGYGHELDAGSLACEAGAADCQKQYGGTDGHLFLPYAMAARLCPLYVKQAVGIDAVTLVNGELSSISLGCPTALEFVARVAITLEDAPDDSIIALDELDGELGALLGYFAAEANLLTAPVAGTLRQRADLAYFSAEPLGDCADTPTGDCVGLDVLQARLDLAEDALLKGLALYRQFSRIDRAAVDLDGDDAIAGFATTSVGVCEACSGNCLDCLAGSENQLHALTYRRLRDALGVYHAIRDGQVEVLWRRLDAMPATCVAPIDTDADGVLDTNACTATDPACADFCPHYDAVAALVAETAADMASVVDDLGDQLAVVEDAGTSPELSALITDVGAWADGIAAGVAADLQAIDSGVDWLGDRKGRWSVVTPASGSTLTEQIEADLAQLEVDADAFAGEYDAWIEDYLTELTVESAFAQGAIAGELAAQDDIATYCADLAGNAAPNGCGVGVALDDSNPTAARINDVLENDFCKVAVGQFANIISVDLIDPSSPYYLDAGDAYLDWVAAAGLPTCPQLVTPDVAALTASYGGSLITTNVLGMERALLDLEVAIKDFDAYVELMNHADALFTTYANAVDDYHARQATREWLTDSLVCGAALIGATAATIGSYGAGAATYVGAASTCVQRYAAGAENLFPNDGNYSAEELNFEASFVNQQVMQAEQLYSATTKLETVMLRVADYQAQVLIYQSELAAFQRTVAFSNTALDTLGTYQPWTDPVYLAFEEQRMASLKASYKDFAARVQDARRTIEYDTGNILPIGAPYARTANQSYWMPRLADVTVASSAGANAPSAYTALEMTGAAPPPAVDQTLVATASLLLLVYDDFRAVYGERLDNGETAYVASGVEGLVDDDGNGLQDIVGNELVYGNSGELAMLRDSRFYDPLGQTASGCAPGWVDVSDYCQAFSNAAVAPAAGNCADIRAKTTTERLGLAHLDHMLRTPGRDTFDCTYDAAAGTYQIAAGVGSGVGGAFTGGVSGDLPFHTNASPWHRDVTGVVDQAFYAAQTATVRALIDVYLDAVLDERYELPTTFRFYPGTYVYHVDMTDPWLEPEHDVLSGAPFAPQTMSEQIDAVAVVCTTSVGCGADSIAVEDSKPIDVATFGPGSKGTRCQYSDEPVTLLDGTVSTFYEQAGLSYVDGSARQAQLGFEMDHDLSAGTVPSFKTTAPESQALIESVLDAGTSLQRPLHVQGMLVGVYGLYDANPVNGAADNGNIWSLHLGNSAAPRLRIAVRYSHYNTDPINGPAAIAIDEFLACPPDSERM